MHAHVRVCHACTLTQNTHAQAHMQHKWGMTKAARDFAEISLRTACAQDREVERYQALTADNVRQVPGPPFVCVSLCV